MDNSTAGLASAFWARDPSVNARRWCISAWAHESELAMAHVMYNTALREAAREKGMRNNHMRCNVCVHREPDEEQSANYCFGVGKSRSSPL